MTLEYHAREFCGKAIELCRGTGIEIGVLHKPMPLEANVIYLDFCKTSELKKAYANDPRVHSIRQVQLTWKGNTYPFIDDNAFDFVVNSHVLEHVPNPGRQIEEWLRIIRPGGVLYMIVPDKRHCFDRRRAITPTNVLIDKYVSNVDRIGLDQYRDYIVNTNGEDGINRNTSEEYIQKCFEEQGSIHAHVFIDESLRVFCEELKRYVAFDVEHFEARGLHIHCALRKAA